VFLSNNVWLNYTEFRPERNLPTSENITEDTTLKINDLDNDLTWLQENKKRKGGAITAEVTAALNAQKKPALQGIAAAGDEPMTTQITYSKMANKKVRSTDVGQKEVMGSSASVVSALQDTEHRYRGFLTKGTDC
jgi:hypothetical protein